MYILITGGFDPLHSGHLAAFANCSRLGKLVVGVNSDYWLINKKTSFLLPRQERSEIIRNIGFVYSVLPDWDDSDGTACEAILAFNKKYKDKGTPLLFANGGDRLPFGANKDEFDLCNSLGIMSVFGAGGNKTASSSTFLKNYTDNLR